MFHYSGYVGAKNDDAKLTAFLFVANDTNRVSEDAARMSAPYHGNGLVQFGIDFYRFSL